MNSAGQTLLVDHATVHDACHYTAAVVVHFQCYTLHTHTHAHTHAHAHTHTVCDPTLATGSLTINSIEHSPKTHLPAASTQLPVIYYNIISCRSDWQCLQLACSIHRHFTNKKMNPCLRMFQAPIWRLLAQHKFIMNTFPMHMLHDQSSTKL